MKILHREFQWIGWHCPADFSTEKIWITHLLQQHWPKGQHKHKLCFSESIKSYLKSVYRLITSRKSCPGRRMLNQELLQEKEALKAVWKNFPRLVEMDLSVAVCELILERQVWAWQKRAPISLKIHPQDLSHIVEGCHNVQPWSPHQSFILNQLLLCYKIAKNGCQFLYL
jgi:hypothetical protein